MPHPTSRIGVHAEKEQNIIREEFSALANRGSYLACAKFVDKKSRC